MMCGGCNDTQAFSEWSIEQQQYFDNIDIYHSVIGRYQFTESSLRKTIKSNRHLKHNTEPSMHRYIMMVYILIIFTTGSNII